MKDLCKANVVKDTRRLFYDKFMIGSNISFEEFLEHTQTGTYTWNETYAQHGIRNILNRTINWTQSGYSSYYQAICTRTDILIQKGEVNARFS